MNSGIHRTRRRVLPEIGQFGVEILSPKEPKPELRIEKIGLWPSFEKQEVGPALRGVEWCAFIRRRRNPSAREVSPRLSGAP
jgi:hypothetical protein